MNEPAASAAIEERFAEYRDPLKRFFYRLSGNATRAEDLVQDVFLRALRYAGAFDAERPFRPWIYGIARNRWADENSAPTRYVDPSSSPSLSSSSWSGPGIEPVSDAPTPVERLLHDERVEAVRSALMQLDPARRELLVLARFQDLPYAEIAQIYGISEANVKVRVFRALQELRNQFHRQQAPAGSRRPR